VALVTGATSGLGLSTAIGLARLGATVRFVGRNKERSATARDTIIEAAPGADVDFFLADMADQEQVRSLASECTEQFDRLDILIHNAGALSKEYTTAADGTETTVEAQLISPFLLTGLLLPLLTAAAPSRVIQVSSGGMYTQSYDLSTLEMGPAEYDGTVAYARVKRAQLVLMHEWVRRLAASGVVYHAMHPGWADTPGIRTGLPGFYRVMKPVLRSADEGAATAVWLAGADEAVLSNGLFWLDRRPRSEFKLPWTRMSEAELDRSGAALWEWCAQRSGWDGLAPPG
jgi:NAD(P)-dependent dehydrogenase (short-subunit alcohol dehydrogenase family)